jgi:hypothetical protein
VVKNHHAFVAAVHVETEHIGRWSRPFRAASIGAQVNRKERATAWGFLLAVFGGAFAVSVGVGLLTQSKSAGLIAYFVVLPLGAFSLLRVCRRILPSEDAVRLPRLYYLGMGLVTGLLVASQLGAPILGWLFAPLVAVVLVAYSIRRSGGRQA